MTTHNKRRRIVTKKVMPARHLTEVELKAITIGLKAMAFLSTLLLAGIAIIQGIKDPVVWAFLGTAIGVILGQNSTNNRD